MSSPPVAASRRAELALRLGVGALLLIAAAWLFGAIAEDVVTGDRLTVLDVRARAVAARARDAGADALDAARHRPAFDGRGRRATPRSSAPCSPGAGNGADLVTVFVCVAGGLTLNVLMKLAFQRARPVFDEPLLTLTSYSFPSGHVAGSTLIYGLIVAWIVRAERARPLVALRSSLAAAGAIALVAFTRMYLGVHYLSDVAAAFAEGVAWLALCLSALAAFWDRAPIAPAAARDGVRASLADGHDRRRDRRHRQRRLGRRQRRGAAPNGSRPLRGRRLHAEIVLAHGGDEIVAARRRRRSPRRPAADRRRRRRRHGQRRRRGAGRQRRRARRAAARHAEPLRQGPRHPARARGGGRAIVRRGRPSAVDVGEVNGRIFINNSSLGLYPDIVRDRERQQQRLGRGKWPAFAWATLAALRRYPFLVVRLVVDGERASLRSAVRLHRQQRVPDGGLRDRRARRASTTACSASTSPSARAGCGLLRSRCARSSAGSARRATSTRCWPPSSSIESRHSASARRDRRRDHGDDAAAALPDPPASAARGAACTTGAPTSTD